MIQRKKRMRRTPVLVKNVKDKEMGAGHVLEMKIVDNSKPPEEKM